MSTAGSPTPPHNAGELAKYAHLEDQHLAGSTWWQWRQACGDPHTIGTPGGTPPPVLIHYQENDCPGDVNKGPVPTWQIVLTRPYLRAAPGRLVSVVSSGPDRTLTAVGTAATSGATVDLWVPGTTAPVIGGVGVARVRVVAVTGGFRVRAHGLRRRLHGAGRGRSHRRAGRLPRRRAHHGHHRTHGHRGHTGRGPADLHRLTPTRLTLRFGWGRPGVVRRTAPRVRAVSRGP